jgi:lysophospholipase L1-like esterase
VPGAYRNRLYTLLNNAGYNVDFVGTFSDASNPGLPDINHQGQGSARIDQIQANISSWLNSVEDPDVVTLMIGTNDFWQNYDIANASTRLGNLIGDIATRRPFAKIIVATLPLRTDNPAIEAQQVAYNSAIPGIVAQQVALGRQVTYVDIHASLSSGDLSPDGVHPLQAGFDKIADAWYPAVAAVVSPAGTSNPPVIAKIGAGATTTSLPVVFSKPVDDSAATIGNFSISGGISISGASLDSAKRTVTLTTSAQTPGIIYNLAVSGVKDRTAQQRLIAPGSMIQFSSSALSNGSFESDYASWTKTGNSEIKSASPYVATNGSKVLAFNTGQSTPNGTVSQTFATTPGQVYQLSFDVGAFGYTTASQRIQVAVQGSTSLVSDSASVTPLGNGTTVWASKLYTFTANSASTTVTFTDTSTTSNSVDLILDNVVVGPQSSRYLAVTTSPDAGASVTVSPPDTSNNGTGSTGFLRTYAANTVVTLTAPANNAGKSFLRWQKNGVDLVGSSAAISVTMDGNHALNAVYGSNNAPVAVADAYAATANSTLTVPAIGVLTNDSDPDGNPLTAALNAAPVNGSLTLNPNGSFTYTPNSGFTGSDSFSYRANDGTSDSNVVTVSLTVSSSGAATQLVTNGSFESNLTSWTTTGNMQIQSASPYAASNGTKLLAFNSGNTTPNGVVSQSFATVSGQTYQLTFDLGILAFNSNSQRAQVAVTGSGSLLSQTITLTGNGSGTTRWFPQTFSFVANSATTTLSFTDTSTTTSNADLLLDNVKVTGSVPNYTLTVASSPSSSVGVAISPPDRNSNSGGSTSFTRSYASGSIVNLSAPAIAGGSAFQKWQKNGSDISTSAATNVTIDADMTLTAVYGSNTAPIAVADSYSTPLNTVLAIPAAGVLSNDSDPELNPLTAVLSVGPTNGTLTLNPNGGFSYTPTTGFTGTDSFTYRANDGNLDSNVVTVTIDVIGGGANSLVNGGFESGETGWTITGNRFVIDSTPPYVPYEGNKLAVLNGGNLPPNAVFSQLFATTPGNTYVLAFEMGVIGLNTSEQKLAVSLVGSSSLLSTTESQFCNGLNNAVWTSKSYVFTANSATTMVSFTDMSASTSGVDLLLDNVRVNTSGASATQTLTVDSTPAAGVGITVSPPDNSSNGNGTTQFTRIYDTNTVVSLTAPATFGTDNFVKWQKNGADLTTSATASVTMDAPYTLTAIYQSGPVIPPFTNGGFEDGENGWTMTGNRVVIDTTPPYLASEGAKLLVFNGGNTPPNATVVQTFATTPGQVYDLKYDVGIFSAAAVQQKLQVDVNGTAALFTQTETLTGNALGNTVWSSKAYTFTADSTATTLTFTDISSTTNGADLLLDKISVSPFVANAAPVAVADSYNTNKNTQLSVSASGVLSNDTDANSNPLTAVLVTGPTNGTLTLNPNGGFTYNPNTDYVGSDAFTYKANDGSLDSNVVTVTINVTPPVIIANGSFEFGETGWTMTGNRLVYPADASYPASDGTNLLVFNGGGTTPDATISQTFPTIAGQAYMLTFDVGAVAFNSSTQKLKIELAGSSPILTDFANLTGNTAYLRATIPFTANSTSTTLTFTDQSASTNGIDMILDNVTVTLGTSAPNAAPVANGNSYTTDANVALTVPAAGVLTNDTDADSDPLTAVLVTGPTNGTLTLNPNGSFTYTPNAAYTGSDAFTYKANDGENDSNVATVSITINTPVVVNGFVNGSFESDFTGWTTSGNVLIQSSSPYAPTNGSKLAGFNGGNLTPNGVVSQTFATTPGVSYSLTFDAGVLSYTTASQKMQVNVTGNSSLLSQSITITRTSGSNNLWLPQSFSFVADSATTTLSFTDTSTTTNLLDLVLDNIVVTANAPVTTRTLTVTSTPATGAAITVSPADNGSNGTGTTQFTRTYSSGAAVTLTAPATFSGNTFSKWQKNGVDLTTNTTANVTMDADQTLTAVYTVPSGGGTNLLTNGSFESNFTGWTNTGSVEIQSSSPYTATDGTKIAGFNGANATPNGVVSQSFATTPGATYTLAFDAGVLSYTTASQKMQVNVNGTASLLNQTVTITRTSGSNNLWLPQTFSFVADSATTTLSFTDTSTSTAGLDLVLDNVRVTLNSAVPVLQTLTVNSTPVSAVAITVSPSDANNAGNGSTSFSRAYSANAVVNLTAPATASGSAFIKWQKDGVDHTTDLTATVTMDTAHTMTAVYANAAFANGSFETGTFSPWVTSGGTTDSVKINSISGGTDGTKIVEFNASNSPTGGVLAQTFATTPGVTYNLSFDLGRLAYNTSSQSIRVVVTGTSSLLNQTTSITGTSNGVMKWEARNYTFTADSTATTLTFTDLSTVTTAIDMFLDNVRVINANARTLTIDSVVAAAVPLTISPVDSNGAGDGSTGLTRTYNTGSVVNVTAPATAANGATFVKWVKDGADFGTNPVTSLTISAHTKLFAIYSGGTNPALGPNLILNGSFESLTPEYAYWARSGSTRIEQPGSASGFTTDGNNLLSFNVGGGANDGMVQQSFATTPGTVYTLQLDPGVYGGPNGAAITQTLNINVVGNAMLLAKSVTIQGTTSTFVWAPQTFTFTADSNTSTLILADGSSSGAGTDLFVDNVRVRAGTLAPSTLTVTSTPDLGKVVTATPDLAEQGNGTTTFNRIYTTGTSVAMVAPYQNFVKWLKNGQWYATNPSINVLADGNHTMTAVYTSTPVLGPFTNGSFESEFTGWTWSGSQQSVKVKDGLPCTDGVFCIEFNSNSSATDGSITQTFTTTPGTAYTINFDMGVNAFNTAQQSLRCLVTGSGTLANQLFSMNNPAGSGVVYTARTVNFTANSTTTTITFSDQSSTGAGLDLLLDNVRLNGSTGGGGGTTTRTLTVTSTPATGAAITVSPADNSSNGNGTTQFTRTYNDNASVTLTAPATFGGNNFSKWQKNGVDVTTNTSTTVAMDADYTLTAVYTAPSGGGGTFTNGNFELNFTAWTATGSTNSILIGSGLPGSNSSKVAAFNSANSPNDGQISQTFDTVSGTTYTVTFDQGVLAYNTSAQTIQVSATGSGSLLSQNFTMNGTGGGNVVWTTRSATFTANSASTTLTFRDVSSTGAGLDLLLDNVAVAVGSGGGGGGGSGNTRTLTVNTTPNTGMAITVSPADNNGQANGSSNFTRTYNTNATVAMVAPYQNFVKWLKNGVWYATNPSITVTLDADTVMTAVYTSTPVLGPFTNGSFESEFTGWTWTGSQQSVKVKDGLPATNGLNVIEFNSNNSANDGAISQTFTTVSGTTYQVTFDMGVLAYTTSEQRMQVTATGAGTLNTEIYSMNGTGGGNVVWSTKTFTFTANSTSTTLTFADKSTTGVALDLLLDYVRVDVTSTPGMGPNMIYNGSFELATPPANFVGWTQSGSNRIEWPGPAYSTDGSKILSYGVGETPTDGSVSQSFATVPGTTYRIRFDLGALGYNAINLTLRVKVDGSGTILNQTTSVLSRNDFVMVWNAKTFDFVANSTTTTLTLADASASGSATDMFVDNVRVNSIATASAPLAMPAPEASAMFIAPEEENSAAAIAPAELPNVPTLTGTPGDMWISLNATEPGRYILERSEDLKNWNLLNELQVQEPGPIEFHDTETGLKRAFYRIGKVTE